MLGGLAWRKPCPCCSHGPGGYQRMLDATPSSVPLPTLPFDFSAGYPSLPPPIETNDVAHACVVNHLKLFLPAFFEPTEPFEPLLVDGPRSINGVNGVKKELADDGPHPIMDVKEEPADDGPHPIMDVKEEPAEYSPHSIKDVKEEPTDDGPRSVADSETTGRWSSLRRARDMWFSFEGVNRTEDKYYAEKRAARVQATSCTGFTSWRGPPALVYTLAPAQDARAAANDTGDSCTARLQHGLHPKRSFETGDDGNAQGEDKRSRLLTDKELEAMIE